MLLPIHWGTFNLAPLAAVALPRPGEPFEPNTDGVPAEPWWRAVARVPAGGWPEATVDPTREPAGGAPAGTGEPEAVTST